MPSDLIDTIDKLMVQLRRFQANPNLVTPSVRADMERLKGVIVEALAADDRTDTKSEPQE